MRMVYLLTVLLWFGACTELSTANLSCLSAGDEWCSCGFGDCVPGDTYLVVSNDHPPLKVAARSNGAYTAKTLFGVPTSCFGGTVHDTLRDTVSICDTSLITASIDTSLLIYSTALAKSDQFWELFALGMFFGFMIAILPVPWKAIFEMIKIGQGRNQGD